MPCVCNPAIQRHDEVLETGPHQADDAGRNLRPMPMGGAQDKDPDGGKPYPCMSVKILLCYKLLRPEAKAHDLGLTKTQRLIICEKTCLGLGPVQCRFELSLIGHPILRTHSQPSIPVAAQEQFLDEFTRRRQRKATQGGLGDFFLRDEVVAQTSGEVRGIRVAARFMVIVAFGGEYGSRIRGKIAKPFEVSGADRFHRLC